MNQPTGAFTTTFSALGTPAVGTTGSAKASPSESLPSAPTASTAADDPATSPYQIWNAAQSYPKNTKIVWHHNVYEAKWYTQGDTPDSPVADPADTPWTLIGPVLPGEHAAPTPTLEAGTYPSWNPSQAYVAGDRVLYERRRLPSQMVDARQHAQHPSAHSIRLPVADAGRVMTLATPPRSDRRLDQDDETRLRQGYSDRDQSPERSRPEVVRGMSVIRWMHRKAEEDSRTAVVRPTTTTRRGAI